MKTVKTDIKDLKHEIEKDEIYECEDHHIYFKSLNLGCNYSLNHFIDTLKEERESIIDYLYNFGLDLNDSIIFHYQGNYGSHREDIAVWDFWDFIR